MAHDSWSKSWDVGELKQKMMFDLHIGIDYSGRATPLTRTSALQVYAAGNDDQEPVCIRAPAASPTKNRHWCRQEIAEWLIEQALGENTFIAGIDHGFSFPLSYFQRFQLVSWSAFLADFCDHWPTDQAATSVDCIRKGNPHAVSRGGSNTELRLTERWTSSAKSVFLFDVQGSVAKSTHAGIPWLRRIRAEVGDAVHFWPFDGWKVPPGKSVISEVYPSIFRNRFPKGERTADQQDAYCVARWLAETDDRGFFDRYFELPLTSEERTVAEQEGWILGIC